MAVRHLGVLLTALLLPAALPAAPYLVKDLNTLPSPIPFQVFPGAGALGPDVSYFPAGDPAHGVELWRSDGTPGGTERLTDLCAGRCDSRPSLIRVHAGKVFFLANDGFSGEELWVSDGTPGSERRVRDLCPGPCSALSGPVEEVGDRLVFFPYFPANPGRFELWQTDGTRGGTVPVKRLCTADCGLYSALVPLGPPADNAVFFVNRPGGVELWGTDGTAAGTRSLRRLAIDTSSGGFTLRLTAGDGFAWVWDAEGLWRTDGTEAGTFLLQPAGALVTNPEDSHSVSSDGLWHGQLFAALTGGAIVRSDGTPEGTVRIAQLANGALVRGFAPLDGEILFPVQQEPFSGNTVLWSSRGTAETTGPKIDLGHGTVGWIAGLGGRAVFSWQVELFDPPQLWTTDGTAAGTRPLALPAADLASQPFFVAGDRAFFLRGAYENDLWITDGTEAGTHRVRDFGEAPGSSGPLDQGALGEKLVFSANTGDGRAPLFLSDGTAAGTELLSERANFASSFFRAGGRLLFSASRVGGYPPLLWSTDGTPAGTVLMTQRTGFSFPAVLNGQILFSGLSRVGIELWKTDGLTRVDLVKDIDPFIVDTGFHHMCEHESSRPVPGVVVGGRLLFAADDGRYGRELWASDGTAAGTVRVRDINPGRLPEKPRPCEDFPGGPTRPDLGLSSSPEGFVLLGSVALFAADDGTRGRELWVSNGTFPGTHRVADLVPGPRGSAPHDLVRFRNRVYFLAANPGLGESLWQTDGTAAGTVRVRDLALDGLPSWGRNLTVAAGRLYLTVYNETTGAELWMSTGDAASTDLLIDLHPGPGSSSPQSLTVIGGALLFAADDGSTGLEPWRTDGTAAGTRQVGDIAPGRDASSPGPFTVIKNLVMTGADDGVDGREPWAIPRGEIVP